MADPQDKTKGVSLDPAEIAKFSALAAQWWDPEGPFAPLHRLNPTRLAFIRDEAVRLLDAPPRGRRPLTGLSILDIGCGGGLVSAPLARLGAAMTSLDASEETIAAARAHAEAQELKIDFRAASVESLAGEQFDIVLALEIVEHVADVAAFLAACANVVRPGGKLIVSTINRTQKARLFAIVGAERFLKWAPEGTHDYEKLVTPEELAAACPTLDWEAPVGLSFDPLARDWKLSRDIAINYFRVAHKRSAEAPNDA
ncbi:MAG: bifunctional 2-polyprenyl-6-hydroxyphenol methylase/3-demethylubiquinol 3-O-methyltransferase UbiG [Hyphomonadaceae bacterium]